MKVQQAIILETRNLFLRELTENDIVPLFKILSDPETMKYYPAPYDRENVAIWVKRNISSYERSGFGLWAVILKSQNVFIGQCGISIQDIDGRYVPEIGYHLDMRYWNRGLATEAAGACLDLGFRKWDLEEIFIHTSIENIPSIRVAEKIGMIKRKIYDKYIASHDIFMKHVVYSKLKNVSVRKKELQ